MAPKISSDGNQGFLASEPGFGREVRFPENKPSNGGSFNAYSYSHPQTTQMKNITDKSQFNLTNAKVQTHGSVTFINFPRVEHRTLSGAVHYPAHTELVAHQSAPGEIFKVVAVTYYISKAYANASEFTGSFHNEPASEAQLASILA